MRPWILPFLACFFGTFAGFSQIEPQLWLSGSVKRELIKDLNAEVTEQLRFYDFGLPGRMYTELSLSYKLVDGVKVSIDYRLVVDENKYSNYTASNRLNFNLDLKKKFKHFNLGVRGRYQNSFSSVRTIENYSPEFDQAFRIKPSLEIKLKKDSRFSPEIAGEWFYTPANQPLGNRFTKYRLSAGTGYNLKGPRSVEIKYLFGQSINLPKREFEHILSLSFTYEWKAKKKDEKKKTE